jgi:hypothetical protein
MAYLRNSSSDFSSNTYHSRHFSEKTTPEPVTEKTLTIQHSFTTRKHSFNMANMLKVKNLSTVHF